ncbi:MAG: hypothetical protein WAO08_30830 [Hyphomicrobiaceae bacterium]
MENWSSSKTDKDARDRAEQIVKDALRVVMRGISISPRGSDCPRLRAQIGIRFIADILYDLSEAYQLDPDLKAVLWDVGNGSEPALPEDLRRYWEDPQLSGHDHNPPKKVQ